MTFTFNRRKRTAAAACLLAMVLPAHAGYEVLHAFRKPGTQAVGKLLRLASGELYGTASAGAAHDQGGVFHVTAGGAVETLVSFTGNSGAVPGSGPVAGLVEGPDGALYGTTTSGGAGGFGTAFKVTTAGSFTKLVDFTGAAGAAKGSVPGPLILHADGFFYGSTAGGGAGGFGTIFKMSPAGALTTLAEFTGTAGVTKGAEPGGPLAADGTTLYGVTRIGGAGNFGTVFRITTGGVFSSLVEFTGSTGSRLGARPAGGLFRHSNGLLYGATEFGGSGGFGTAFSLTTAVSPVFTTLRSFVDLEGSQPVGEFVAADASNLLGTMAAGGSSGWGGVYKLSTSGTFTVLASFSGETGLVPGAVPRAGLVPGSGGLFLGCTSGGGPGNLGMIFSISAAGTFTPAAAFSPTEGWRPSGAPVPDGAGGWLFPVALGGNSGGGTLAKWTPAGGLTLAATLGGSVGSTPTGSLLAKSGIFYGVASEGAISGRGSAFRFDPASGTTLVNAFTSSGGSLAEGPFVTGSDAAFYAAGREGGASARGTLFKVTAAGVRTRVISFTGTNGAFPGQSPRSPIVLAPNQTSYGVTERGGSSDSGVLYKLSPAGTYTPVVQFGSTGPRLPGGGLVLAGDGMIYGTCSRGGSSDAGAVIRINPADSSWSVVASFDGTTAAFPAGELHAAADGSIYGIATGPGAGGIFRYSAALGLHLLSTFTGDSGNAPGTAAEDNGAGLTFTGGLATAPGGVVYGTASGSGPEGGGVWFRVVPDSPLAAWKFQHLGSVVAPDDGDPDQDHLPNLAEYALGTLPMSGVSLSPLKPVISGTYLTMEVPRDPARGDVTLIAEASPDMNSWVPIATSANGTAFSGPGYVSGETGGSGVKAVLIRDLVPVAGSTRRFLRLRVTR